MIFFVIIIVTRDIITNNEFTEDGFVVTKNGLAVPAYIASGEGFSRLRKEALEKKFYDNK